MVRMSKLAIIDNINLIEFPYQSNELGDLSIFEASSSGFPFHIERVFTIQTHHSCQRGNHAHKLCHQILIASAGTCQVTCDDGDKKKTVLLNKPNQGLHIPPGIWASQEYMGDMTVLMVLCSHPYDELDYIRHYPEFQLFRNHASD